MAAMREMGDYRELEELVRHHIDSYDYMVDRGLEIMLDNIKPVKIHDPFTDTSLSIFLSNPRLYEPQKERGLKTKLSALFPFECRQAKISYTGRFEADVCFQYNGRQAIRERFNFGQLPIMLKVCVYFVVFMFGVL
uniref:DNA-directed RNA polymerase n=1 Tax=Rhizophora mucronata TaxID=61149 RepID=A0A2P2LTW3_RHIMU